MRVGVIGSGRIGGNAGTQLARAGHEVMFSFGRNRAALDEFAAGVPGASAGSPEDARRIAAAAAADLDSAARLPSELRLPD